MNTIDRINLRFKSGNNTPVERAYVTAEEWAVVHELIGAVRTHWDSGRPVTQRLHAALSALTEDKGNG